MIPSPLRRECATPVAPRISQQPSPPVPFFSRLRTLCTAHYSAVLSSAALYYYTLPLPHLAAAVLLYPTLSQLSSHAANDVMSLVSQHELQLAEEMAKLGMTR